LISTGFKRLATDALASPLKEFMCFVIHPFTITGNKLRLETKTDFDHFTEHPPDPSNFTPLYRIYQGVDSRVGQGECRLFDPHGQAQEISKARSLVDSSWWMDQVGCSFARLTQPGGLDRPLP
jgi:hypothetical protein